MDYYAVSPYYSRTFGVTLIRYYIGAHWLSAPICFTLFVRGSQSYSRIENLEAVRVNAPVLFFLLLVNAFSTLFYSICPTIEVKIVYMPCILLPLPTSAFVILSLFVLNLWMCLLFWCILLLCLSGVREWIIFDHDFLISASTNFSLWAHKYFCVSHAVIFTHLLSV